MEKKKNFISYFTYIVSALFLGALGSGLWELFLKNFLYYIGNAFVQVAASMQSGYIDGLYKYVGSGVDIFLYFPSIIIFSIMISSPIIVIFLIWILTTLKYFDFGTRRDTEVEPEEDERVFSKEKSKVKRKINLSRNNRVLLMAGLFLISLYNSVVYIDRLLSSVVNIKSIKIVETRLDIIRPYVSTDDYYRLVSQFRLIETRGGMQEIINKTDAIAMSNNVKLKPVFLYGIKSKFNGQLN